ncbi:hypothetical protein [Streptomyces sp. AK02-01A]|uniref:hypothetical protein n=1 Tax=Streptomyces sp. AK02-01A TaxID=3028648 RepID=UPI0029B52352|nr:hypothetical protein [Streptomyces sp. AK02-01A]MDX3849096.1 hypothetical protein [Streptomyces sp. AK02-01A]
MLALGLGVSACGSGDEDEGPRFVGAEKVCDSVFSGDVAAALETAIGDTTFLANGDGALDRTATAVKDFYADGQDVNRGQKFCSVNGKKRGSGGMDISFGLYKQEDALSEGHSASQRPYDLGKRALAGTKNSSLYFECVSPRLDGSDKEAARVLGGLRYSDRELEGTRAEQEANLTVLHAASLALAKKLECENNGGLPTKVVLQPK